MAVDFLFEVNQWVELHWKQVTGIGQKSLPCEPWLISGESITDIVIWTWKLMIGLKVQHGKSLSVHMIERWTEKSVGVKIYIKRHTWNAAGGKEIMWPTHLLQTPSLFLKWRNQEKKGKRRKSPRIHSKSIKYYIADKQIISNSWKGIIERTLHWP